jgi:hypothetical protein
MIDGELKTAMISGCSPSASMTGRAREIDFGDGERASKPVFMLRKSIAEAFK